MRKSQREITDIDAVVKVLERCQTIRLGLQGDRFPYVVPLSFGLEKIDGNIFVYFHCAKEGKKIDLISKNSAVCFESDILDGYVKIGKSVTADYKSVIGFGFAERVLGDDAVHGLDLLLKHCDIDGVSAKDCVFADAVAVYRIDVKTVTGKQRFE